MGAQRTGLILLLILCFAVVSISQIGTVKAESIIYIRADGSVEGTDKIQREGNVYTFTGDVFDCIVVEKDDVVIDGAGYTLNGTGIGTGINLTGRTNVTIGNMQICGFEHGIQLQSSSRNTIYGNIIVNNLIGIHFVGCVYNTVFDNVIAYNSIYGISLAGSSYNSFFRNDIVDNHNQVHCWFGASNIYDNGSVGNYWSNYNGTDTDNDGIGDEPHFIPVTNIGYELNDTDNYPLMEPYIIPEFPSLAILPLLITATLVIILCKQKLPKTPNPQSY